MSLPDLSSTPRTELGRHRERGRTERDDLYAVLDAGLICHLGVIVGGAPRVLPTGYGRLGDLLYLHGSSANSSITAGNGQEVCVTVTHLDGLVCARSVFNHSMNYRSAVVFGVARLVADPEEKLLALRTITEHLVPGQWSYVRQPSKKELAATSALALPLTEASVKIRSGGPSDEPEDYELDLWAGVVPVTTGFGEPEPDAVLRRAIDTPAHIVKRGGLPQLCSLAMKGSRGHRL
ncbi:MAG TPA: pyridoxamine 5'-phosphate oxidase family protein [Streptosporangiaceae bacterium]|jgi:nitroimidazol reductase NimA-like FMN-containing flavoprotein (pyridoxamine 5'-phosphate oxidase superfamily)|nr:pyridoxamine 5'-phosphate oxidase family protein [Streptosporangiaceae bacterium]